MGDRLLSPEEERILRKIREWQEIKVEPKDLKKFVEELRKPVVTKIKGDIATINALHCDDIDL